MARSILQLSDLNTHYGDSHVLHGVSLDLKEGHLLALMGRNGAGKSTTLMSLSGLLPHTSGALHLNGQSLSQHSPEMIAKSGIRLVPQGRRIFASLSVEENLVVAEQLRSQSNHWNLAKIYALFPSLASRKQQRALTLSGGEQQMLAIGRALMGNPSVLLLDEPCEGLAPLIVHEVNQTIAKLKNEGLSIILVEQNFSVAKSLADDFVILNTGRVVFSGTAQDVQSDPNLATQHLGVF